MVGRISPAEVVEILQRTMEEQGLAFGSTARAQQEEKVRADRRLREEQDAAYLASLQIDKVCVCVSVCGYMIFHVLGPFHNYKAAN